MASKIMEKIAQKKINVYISNENFIADSIIDVSGQLGKITLVAPNNCYLIKLSPKNYASDLPLDKNNEWTGGASEIKNHRIFAVRKSLCNGDSAERFRFPYELPITTAYGGTLFAKLIVVANYNAALLSPIKLIEQLPKDASYYDVSDIIYVKIDELVKRELFANGDNTSMTVSEYSALISSMDTELLVARTNEAISDTGLILTALSLSMDGPSDATGSTAWSNYKKELEEDSEHNEELRKIRKDREFLEEFEKNSVLANKIRLEKFSD